MTSPAGRRTRSARPRPTRHRGATTVAASRPCVTSMSISARRSIDSLVISATFPEPYATASEQCHRAVSVGNLMIPRLCFGGGVHHVIFGCPEPRPASSRTPCREPRSSGRNVPAIPWQPPGPSRRLVPQFLVETRPPLTHAAEARAGHR
jgi:hypothetical protein